MTLENIETLIIIIGFERKDIDFRGMIKQQWVFKHDANIYYFYPYSGIYTKLQKNFNSYTETIFEIPYVFNAGTNKTELHCDKVYEELKKEFKHILRKKKIISVLNSSF